MIAKANCGGRVVLLLAFSLAATAVLTGCGSSSGSPLEDSLVEYQRGIELEEKGNFERALEAYNAALDVNPRLAEAYAARANVFYTYDSLHLALADVNRAIILDSEMARAYYYRGLILAAGKDTENAVLNFTKAIQINPGMGDAYFARSKLYFDSEDYEDAIGDLSDAIRLEPQSPRLYLTRGQLYMIVEDTAKAEADLEQVLSLTQDEALIASAKRMLLSGKAVGSRLSHRGVSLIVLTRRP